MRLFESFSLAGLPLQNRIVMAPMTRSRAEADGRANANMAEYYRQRASAGLIVSEAINVSAQGTGYIFTPGLYTKEHVESWKPVTKAVHDAGGKIFAQLMHGGRIGHPELSGGLPTVAPSAVQPAGQVYLANGMGTYAMPLELTIAQIETSIEDFVAAAKNAIEAGFDGIEIHGANGYLPNQFLAESTNQRTDAYGGSVENRCRFLLELTTALVQAVGGARVGLRLSPVGTNNGAVVDNPLATYTYLLTAISSLQLGYVHLMEGFKPDAQPSHWPKEVAATFRPFYKNTLIASGGMTADKANHYIETGTADLIAFGQAFVANPDLVARLQHNHPLATADRATLYSGGARGYTDYPAYAG